MKTVTLHAFEGCADTTPEECLSSFEDLLKKKKNPLHYRYVAVHESPEGNNQGLRIIVIEEKPAGSLAGNDNLNLDERAEELQNCFITRYNRPSTPPSLREARAAHNLSSQVIHTVFWQYNPLVTDEQKTQCEKKLIDLTQESDGEHLGMFQAYITDVDVMNSERTGLQFSQLKHVLVMHFQSAEARNAYLEHPRHQEVVDWIHKNSIIESFVALDHNRPQSPPRTSQSDSEPKASACPFVFFPDRLQQGAPPGATLPKVYGQ